MEQEGKTPLSNGLPALLTNENRGFERLCDILGLQNRKQRQAFIGAEGVKRVLQGRKLSITTLPTAERQRVAIPAFYENPEVRRNVWRHELDRADEVPPESSWPIPSIEYHALLRYDPKFRSREGNESSFKESLIGVSDAEASFADVPEWQQPALRVWPAVRQDIVNWNALSATRREIVALTAFAVATILDDARFLQWAADQVDTLVDEFSLVLRKQANELQVITSGDVIEQWNETCNAIAATAQRLGADPPQPQHLQVLRLHVDALDRLRESVVVALERAVPENRLQKFDETVKALIDEFDQSPIKQCAGQIRAQ